MLVVGDFVGLETLSGGVRLSQAEIARAVHDYPGTLMLPPNSGDFCLDVIELTGSRPRRWSVDIALWTREEGRSDLTMQVTMTDSGSDLLDVEIDNIHVL